MSKANLDKDDESMLTSGRVHLKVNGASVFHGWNVKNRMGEFPALKGLS